MKVRMTNSVNEYVAGEEYEIDPGVADAFILCGYAEGVLSRDYDEGERQLITANHQVVSLGG